MAADVPPPAASLGELEDAIDRGRYGPIVAIEAEQHRTTTWSYRTNRSDAEWPHDIRSAGKSLTALAVGVAIADGHLESLDAKVWPILGAPENDPHNDITVSDLLTMSSALNCDDSERRSPGQEERMYRTRDWRAFAMSIPIDPEYRRDGSGQARFSYCTAGVFLLGQVVEAVTGERFDTYVERRIFAPLGITNVVWRRSPSGQVQSGGQLRIGAADLGKIGRMVLDRGRWGDEQIVPEAWVAEMLTPRAQPAPGIAYGYLWWLYHIPTPIGPQPSWIMSGNGGNLVAIFRAYDSVVVVQSAAYNQSQAGDRSFAIVRDAIAAMALPE
ncbi:serine hydrolase domain-containing protein [Qipengyuania sp. ASV99]|uniref:serine hydrolase domain-containing protein n=1 Tax=Qipengyuania sp. ASV99 TaxID=3399681 RepID=UPI003A4C78BA